MLQSVKSKNSKIDIDFVLFLVVMFTLGITLLYNAQVFAKEVCPIQLDERSVARVPITARGTVLSFPVKPTKVILGKNHAFGIEYVENDLAISPLAAGSRSNLFVYLEGRRFTFDLYTDLSSGCSVVTVHDSHDVQTRVDFGKIK